MNLLRRPLNSMALMPKLTHRHYSIVCSKPFENRKMLQPTSCQPNIRQLSYLNELNEFMMTISKSTPVIWFQHNLIEIHNLTGLPWWLTIISSTILLRIVITTPLTIYQRIIMARLELITLEIQQLNKEIKAQAAAGMKQYNWTQKETELIYQRSLKKQWTNLIVRENCHPLKTMIVLWGQIPLWITQSMAIRNLVSLQPDPSLLPAQIAYIELTSGGFSFIPNLTDVDHSLILPVFLGILNLMIIELQTLTRVGKQQTRFQRFVTNFFRGLSILMVPIAATVPSALSLYWTTSSAFGLIQNIVLMSPKFKRTMGIPLTPSQIDRPYKQAIDALQMRINNSFKWRQSSIQSDKK